MTFKDPEVSKAYHREYKRNLRSGAGNAAKTDVSTTRETLDPAFKARTASDLLAIAEYTLNEVIEAPIDIAVKGRTISSLLNSAIRLVEAANIEQRIQSLEDTLASGVVRELSEP